MKIELLSVTPNAIDLIATAASRCYSPNEKISLPKREDERADYIERILKHGHTSILEHVSLTFHITGISRVTTHQLVRHRMASYCLSGDTIIQSYPKNSRIVSKRRTIREMYQWQQNNKPYNKSLILRSMDENHTIVKNKIVKVYFSGMQQVYELETESGRKIQATSNHKFFTRQGWKELQDINLGEEVLVNGIELLKNKDWLEYNFITLNKTRKEVAKLIGCCESYLYKALKYFKIKKPYSMYPNRKAGFGKKGMFTSETKKLLSEQKKGDKNPSYINNREKLSISGGYTEASRHIPKRKCEFCSEIDKLEVHHIDKNPRNNISSNVKILCSKHHHAWHHSGSIGAFFDKVISITKKEIVDTYDLEMEKPYHNYVANGFVVHNSQQSLRYTKATEPSVVIPNSILNDTTHCVDLFNDVVRDILVAYDKFVRAGIPAEDARYILPMGIKTNIVVTMNCRELYETFFPLRMCCYDSETEVLTTEGWKYFTELTYADELYSLNPNTNNVEYVQAKNIINEPYNGDMINVRSQSIDLCVTPNHNMYCSYSWETRKFALKKASECLEKKQIIMKKDCLPIEGIISNNYLIPEVKIPHHNQYKEWDIILPEKDVPINEFFQFVGMWLSDGYTCIHGRHYIVGITKGDYNKIIKYKNILSSITRNKIRLFKDNRSDKVWRIQVHDRQLFTYLRSLGNTYTKYIPNDFFRYDHTILSYLFAGLCDGDCNKTHTIYTTVSKELADGIQRLCLHLGITATIGITDRTGVSRIIINKRTNTTNEIISRTPAYNVSINRTKNTPMIKTTNRDPFSITKYTGSVHCVTLPINNIIYVRRNGRTVWSGNSHTQWELRELAQKMYLICMQELSAVFQFTGAQCKVKGFCPENDKICPLNKWAKDEIGE